MDNSPETLPLWQARLYRWLPVTRILHPLLNAQLFRFLVVGGLNTLFGYGIIFSCMYLLDLAPEISNMIGYGIGLMLSYTLHRTVTFQSSTPRTHAEIVKFLSVFAIAYCANLGLLFLLVRVFLAPGWLGQVAAGILYVLVTFLLNKHYVFSKKPPTECNKASSGA